MSLFTGGLGVAIGSVTFFCCKDRCEASSSGCRWFFHLLFARFLSPESECRRQEKLNQRCPRCTCSRPSRSLLLAYSHFCRCCLRRLMCACRGLSLSIHRWAWRCHWQCHFFSCKGRCEASSSGCRWFFHLLFARCRSSESECRRQEKLNQRCPRCTCSRPSRSLLLAYSHLCRCCLRRLMCACRGLSLSIHRWAWRCHWQCHFLSCKGRCEASSSGCRWFFHLLFARCRSSESECRRQEKLNQRCPRCTCSRPSVCVRKTRRASSSADFRRPRL